jgi:dihydroorotate dehydrogenase (NAD+) catalytic subunit
VRSGDNQGVKSSPTSLAVDVAGLALRTPVILAAGTAGYIDEMADAIDLSRVGAVVTKSITGESREGNRTWRIIEHPTASAMLNAIGLANVGIDRFVAEYGGRIAGAGTTVIGSIAGSSIEEYTRVARGMAGLAGMPAVELNVSCPNVHGGCEFGVDAGALRELLSSVRSVLGDKRLLVKLSPIAVGGPGANMIAIARAAIEGGAHGLCIANTVPAMAIDVNSRRPRLSNVTGGLSGPAVHPIAVKLVHDVYRGLAREAGVPIIGIGGVLRWEDAAEFILAGATAVEMGTALFADPRSPLKVAQGLESWVRRQNATGVHQLVGAVAL